MQVYKLLVSVICFALLAHCYMRDGGLLLQKGKLFLRQVFYRAISRGKKCLIVYVFYSVVCMKENQQQRRKQKSECEA